MNIPGHSIAIAEVVVWLLVYSGPSRKYTVARLAVAPRRAH